MVDNGHHQGPEPWLGVRLLGSALFFRIWVIWGGLGMMAWAFYSLHHVSWVAQLLYVLLVVWLFTTSTRDLCARCQFYDSWHCGGIGKVAARFVPLLKDPIPLHQSQKHYALMFLALLGIWVGLFTLHLLAGITGLIWTVVAAVAAIPRGREYSWKMGRSEAKRRSEHPLDLQLAEESARLDGRAKKGSNLSYTEGIDLIPLSSEDEAGGIEGLEGPHGPAD